MYIYILYKWHCWKWCAKRQNGLWADKKIKLRRKITQRNGDAEDVERRQSGKVKQREEKWNKNAYTQKWLQSDDRFYSKNSYYYDNNNTER